MLPRRQWEGTPSRDKHRPKSWQETASAMSSRLLRAAPSLRRAGIEVEFSRSGKRRVRKIKIRTGPDAPLPHRAARSRCHQPARARSRARPANAPTVGHVTVNNCFCESFSRNAEQNFALGRTVGAQAQLEAIAVVESAVNESDARPPTGVRSRHWNSPRALYQLAGNDTYCANR
jgi:hypothetical protein